MDLELEGDLFDSALREDTAELFSSCLRLVKTVEEYIPEEDTTSLVVKKDLESGKALKIIRRTLKKYAGHEDLPIRRQLHKWNVLRDKLLPMVSRYHKDRCVACLSCLCVCGVVCVKSALTLVLCLIFS